MKAPIAILLAATLLTATATASICPPLDRTPTAQPVYVVLYGYPHAPDEPGRSLTRVDEDLLHMADFFNALAPRRVWVHGEPEPNLTERFGPGLLPPTWRALRATIDELDALTQSEPGARVYLYFSGHGVRTQRGSDPSTELFGRPEPGAIERGYNGRIDGGILADHILAPLSDHADVHLIVDTCMSFFLLSARAPGGVTQVSRARKAPPRHHLQAPFAAKLPHVGASLAAQYVTYEAADLNGIFSHAVRTASLGIADLNEDGRITYGELHYALIWLLGNMPAADEPTVVPPGLDRDATFIDWRGSPAARVCIPSSLAGPHVLATAHGPNASLPLHPQRPGAIWLQNGRSYRLIGKHHDLSFLASDGALAIAPQPSPVERSVAYRPLFDRPIEVSAAYPLPIVPTFEPGWYIGGGVSGAIGDIAAANLGEQWTPSALAHGRIGHARHRLDVEVGWSLLGVRADATTPSQRDHHAAEVHTLVARAGYDHLLFADEWELGLAALIGGAQRLDSADGPSPEGALRATALFPMAFGSRLSMRVDARAVLMPVGSSLATLLQLGVGLDFESPLD